MLRVFLVRHGETTWNRDHRIQGGGSDIPLNETGSRQKELIAGRLKNEKFEAIYSSHLKRALDTARAIAGYHNLEVTVEPALREVDVGELEGVSVVEVGRRMDEILSIDSNGKTVPTMPGGESMLNVQARVWGVLQRLVPEHNHSDNAVVVVSHYFAILSVICKVLNVPLSQVGRFRMNPGTISTVAFDGSIPRLLSFNDSGHLADIPPAKDK